MDGRCGGRKDNIVAPRLHVWSWSDRALPTVVPVPMRRCLRHCWVYRYIASPGRVAGETRWGTSGVWVRDAASIGLLGWHAIWRGTPPHTSCLTAYCVQGYG